jgi:GT2 family glycosyltransferase
VTLVPTGANLGFAGGNNAGIAAAGLQRYSHFWLLNTDTVVHHQALQALLARAQAAPQPGIVGSTLLYYDRPDCVQATGGGRLSLPGLGMSHIGEGSATADLPRSAAGLAAVEAEMAYVVGASMLVTARFIREVGPMCEDYFLYFEELDWALRSRGRFALGYASDSRVFHKVGGSSTQSVGDLAFTLLVRNQLRFAARFLPERVPAVQRRLALEFVRHLARQRWAAARVVGRALLDSRRLVASAAVAGRTP